MMTPMVNPKILRKSCENCIIIALLIIHNFVAYFTFEFDQKVSLEFKINMYRTLVLVCLLLHCKKKIRKYL